MFGLFDADEVLDEYVTHKKNMPAEPDKLEAMSMLPTKRTNLLTFLMVLFRRVGSGGGDFGCVVIG